MSDSSASSLPPSIRDEIIRDNYLDLIDSSFQKSAVVIIKAPDGYGKTTLLKQFEERHGGDCITQFILPHSRYAYDPAIIIASICDQISSICGTNYDQHIEWSEARLRTLYSNLANLARRKKKPFYFIVDGLEDIPAEDINICQEIIELLPIGTEKFCFLFAGNVRLSRLRRPACDILLPALTRDETIRLISRYSRDTDCGEKLFQITRGVPGHISSIERLLNANAKASLSDVLDSLNVRAPDFFDAEWKSVDTTNDALLNVLAIVVFAKSQVTLATLTAIVNIDTPTVRELFRTVTFVSIQNDTVAFASDAHRKFVAQKLAKHRAKAHNLILDYLLSCLRIPGASLAEEASSLVPNYMQETNRWDELLAFLSPTHFESIVDNHQSLAPVQRNTGIGITTAHTLNRDGELLRFCMQRSATFALMSARATRTEIEVRMLLDNPVAAQMLAQEARFKEERLQLLAALAHAQWLAGRGTDHEILSQIRLLLDEVDPIALGGELATSIAADLICLDSNAAINLVERATNARTERAGALDWAFARLSLATVTGEEATVAGRDVAAQLQEKIVDPVAQRLSRHATLVLGNYEAQDVIAEVEKLGAASDRLSLLRRWAVVNRAREDAGDVIHFAMNFAIKASEISLTAKVLRELATPLCDITDIKLVRQLVGMFESQRATAEHLGPTDEYIELWATLARAEHRYDMTSAHGRIIDMVKYVDSLSDVGTKASCLARLVCVLNDVDTSLKLEHESDIHTRMELALYDQVQLLLDKTAEHTAVLRPVLEALAPTRLDLALSIARQANTETRRDRCISTAILAGLSEISDDNIINDALRATTDICDDSIRGQTLAEIYEVAMDPKHARCRRRATLQALLEYVSQIPSLALRCRAAALVYGYLISAKEAGDFDTDLQNLLANLQQWWEQIDIGWVRVAIGFDIAKVLAHSAPNQALSFQKQSYEYRSVIGLGSGANASTCSFCIQLAIRAYRGLLDTRHDIESDLERIGHLIDMVPSSGEQAILWASVATTLYLAGRTEDASAIVGRHVRTRVDRLWSIDPIYGGSVIVDCAHALYLGHKTIGLERISRLPRNEQDDAYHNICRFICRRNAPDEPYDGGPRHEYDLSYENVTDLVELLKLMDNDSATYVIIDEIATALTGRKSRNKLTGTQRSEIARNIEGLIQDKLPNKRHIRHAGYKILARAQVCRIKQGSKEEWESLITEARAIENTSDRAFIIASLGEILPDKTKIFVTPTQLFQEACAIVPSIPSEFDKIIRYRSIASDAMLREQPLARKCIQQAMGMATDPEIVGAAGERRRIVDLAYRIDADFANSLASMFDDDPARELTRRDIRAQLDILKLKKDIGHSDKEEKPKSYSISKQARASWLALGAMNANRQSFCAKERARELIKQASEAPIRDSYPTFAYVIQSAVSRYRNSKEAKSILRPMFEGLLLSTELVFRVARRGVGVASQQSFDAVPQIGQGGLLLDGVGRTAAMEYISRWLSDVSPKELLICDPYLGPDDLELIKMVKSWCPECHVRVLTSEKIQSGTREQWPQLYRSKWAQISDEDAPDTEIVVVGTEGDKQSPVHDRWYLAEKRGLRIGTSFGSLGVGRVSEVSELEPEQVQRNKNVVERFFQRRVLEHEGKQLRYKKFTLS